MATRYDTHEVLNQAPPLEGYDVFTSDRALSDAVDREGAGWARPELEGLGVRAGAGPTQELGRLANEYRPVLREVNWELRRGDQWAVVGANGAGKSSFLKLLYGDLSPAWGGAIWAPNGIALDPATHTLFTANFYNASVSTIDLTGLPHRLSAPLLPVGSAPEDLVLDPGDHTIYASSSLDGTVSVVGQ